MSDADARLAMYKFIAVSHDKWQRAISQVDLNRWSKLATYQAPIVEEKEAKSLSSEEKVIITIESSNPSVY